MTELRPDGSDLCECGHVWGLHRSGPDHDCMVAGGCYCPAFRMEDPVNAVAVALARIDKLPSTSVYLSGGFTFHQAAKTLSKEVRRLNTALDSEIARGDRIRESLRHQQSLLRNEQNQHMSTRDQRDAIKRDLELSRKANRELQRNLTLAERGRAFSPAPVVEIADPEVRLCAALHEVLEASGVHVAQKQRSLNWAIARHGVQFPYPVYPPQQAPAQVDEDRADPEGEF